MPTPVLTDCDWIVSAPGREAQVIRARTPHEAWKRSELRDLPFRAVSVKRHGP